MLLTGHFKEQSNASEEGVGRERSGLTTLRSGSAYPSHRLKPWTQPAGRRPTVDEEICRCRCNESVCHQRNLSFDCKIKSQVEATAAGGNLKSAYDQDNSLNIDGSVMLRVIHWPTNGQFQDCVDKVVTLTIMNVK